MSDLPTKQEDHPAHNIPDATEHYHNHQQPTTTFSQTSDVQVSRGGKSNSERKDQTRYGDDSSKDSSTNNDTVLANETNYFVDRR